MTDPKHTDTSRSGDLVERLATAIKEGMGAQLGAVPIHPNPAVDDWTATGGAVDLTKIAEGLLPIIADRIEALEAENERLREALGEICRDSNPDWTEKRVYPNEVLDDIHTIAVNAYYKVNP